jgi:Fur family ferric uptake transcriptional regulator
MPDAETARRLIADFEGYLRKKNLKLTQQRQVIARTFFHADDEHLTLSQLLLAAQEEKSSIGYATVYRTMKLMTESGVAVEHKFVDGGEALFEPNIEGDHHDHIICVTCGQIIEFEDEVIEGRQDAIAAEKGFEVKRHRLEIYGECIRPACENR